MKINKKKAGLAAGLVAAVTMVIAPAAFAASTVKVGGTATPVGPVAISGSVKSPGVEFNTNFGVLTACTASTISGTVNRGTVVSGSSTQIGVISAATFTGCTAAGGLPVIIKKDPKVVTSWPIHVVGVPPKGQDLIPIQIRNITVKMHSTIPAVPSAGNKWPCYLKATGTVNGTFRQSTQQILIDTAPAFPFAITAFDGASESAQTVLPPSGPGTCGGTIFTGDSADMDGDFAVTGAITY